MTMLERWETMMQARLAPIVAPLVDAGTARARLNAHHLGSCPARAVADHDGEFSWSPARAARTIAVVALGSMGTRTAVEAVGVALDDLAAQRESVSDFVAALTPGARSQLTRRAVEMTSALWLRRPPRTGTRFRRTSFSVRVGAIDVVAHSEMDRVADGRITYGLIDVRSESLDTQLGHLALLAVAKRGSAVSMVAGFHAARGVWVTRPVTEEFLDVALERLADRASEFVAHRSGVNPLEVPGAWCRWCVRHDVCVSAAAMASDPGRRIGGLPVDQWSM
jgi:hypothetical protein